MSVADDSPVNSSSSDDFASFLDTELDSTSDTSPEPEEEANETYHSDGNRTKRQKIEVLESVTDANDSTPQHETTKTLEASMKDICTHPGVIGGMCIKCGEKMDNQSGVAFGYIHKDLRLANDEIVRLRDRDLKNLFNQKKLCLVLDLDHTLLNSTRFMDVTQEEGYLMNQSDPMQDVLRGTLFKLDSMRMLTKLRPFVHTFLKEASKLFEMYIYTMGERAYALEMATLLDPGKIYFDSRVIAQSDCTQRHQKGLDVVLGQESAVLILDDTEAVWVKHKGNLILMERYHFFASSCKQFGYRCKSLSELKNDESEDDGALATVLQVLKRIHSMFFDPVLGTVRSEILKGCKIVFSRVFPTKFQAENHHLWKMAERLGATCATEVDPSVTHVISTDIGTEKSRWAVDQKKFLVEPRWLEAANYLWQRQPEELFPVNEIKNNR
ncbi:BRCT domain-containing protein [Cynara cardunculus var. scolymus]|uniref:RNA polymerase II C-terminal domain phosphatase-like n=1 Tax=Cynara cardunculus var. scolymus TaxID=59895 RepID=A0A124SDP8_CYNCS|nr:BRCT domain-containing protein [Cynara cardunculus var. scolymus]